MRRKSHNRIKTSVDFFDFRHAEPFLHAVASCFIERLATGDVVADFLFGQYFSFYFRNIRHRNAFFCASKRDSGKNLMGISGKFSEHFFGLVFIFWFSENFVSNRNNGICGD